MRSKQEAITNSTKKRWTCVECWEPIRGSLYLFAGAFACEKCVRVYYRGQGVALIELELKERAAAAEGMLLRLGKEKRKDF